MSMRLFSMSVCQLSPTYDWLSNVAHWPNASRRGMTGIDCNVTTEAVSPHVDRPAARVDLNAVGRDRPQESRDV